MQNARNAATSRHDEAHALATALARLPLDERLKRAAELGNAVFTTSLGLEDQVLTAASARSGAAPTASAAAIAKSGRSRLPPERTAWRMAACSAFGATFGEGSSASRAASTRGVRSAR